MTNIQYWLWLTLKKGITSSKISSLLEVFETPEEVFSAEPDRLRAVPGLSKHDISRLTDRSMAVAEKVASDCRKHSIRILTFDSPYYPALLKEIYDPPYVLYARYKERIDLNEHLCLAMVGTRDCSDYGITVAQQLSYDLAREGMTVVSGMARGIDGAAATGALRAGGVTVAVLGNGLDICYPPEHAALMEHIIEHGMLLSEYPPGSPPLSKHFLPRNRIITGLSQGTVVVEAPARSGALNSANWTCDHGRELFVVPGDVTRPSAKGSNRLMVSGALPVLSAEDVLCVYQERFCGLLETNRPEESKTRKDIAPYPTSKTPVKEKVKSFLPARKKAKEKTVTKQVPPPLPDIPLSETEKAVYRLLSYEPVHIDTLAEHGFPAATLAATMTSLEIKGLVCALPGRQFCLPEPPPMP